MIIIRIFKIIFEFWLRLYFQAMLSTDLSGFCVLWTHLETVQNYIAFYNGDQCVFVLVSVLKLLLHCIWRQITISLHYISNDVNFEYQKQIVLNVWFILYYLITDFWLLNNRQIGRTITHESFVITERTKVGPRPSHSDKSYVFLVMTRNCALSLLIPNTN